MGRSVDAEIRGGSEQDTFTAGHWEAPEFEGGISHGQKWGAGWRARTGARLGSDLWLPTPLQCLEQQTEEVGEGVSEIVLVGEEGRQGS